jgi:cystathionine gamma-synthase
MVSARLQSLSHPSSHDVDDRILLQEAIPNNSHCQTGPARKLGPTVSSYDLLQNPLWRIDDFGKPMPNDRHAISAAIPTWTQLIAFGNGELIIPGGYPRFVYHRDYEALCDRFRLGGDMTRLFPSEKAAKACLKFLDGEGRIAEAPHGLYSITLAGATAEWLSDGVKLFWQHTGLVISSRRAYDILNEKPAPDAAAAKLEIKARIASLAGVDAGDVYLFPSGMAAMLSAHALVTARKPKTPTVQFGFPYLDTLKLQLKFGQIRCRRGGVSL